MSDPEQGGAEADAPVVCDQLVEALEELDSGIVDDLREGHGGVARTFLNRDLVHFTGVRDALKIAVPSDDPTERTKALYAALDYMQSRRKK